MAAVGELVGRVVPPAYLSRARVVESSRAAMGRRAALRAWLLARSGREQEYAIPLAFIRASSKLLVMLCSHQYHAAHGASRLVIGVAAAAPRLGLLPCSPGWHLHDGRHARVRGEPGPRRPDPNASPRAGEGSRRPVRAHHRRGALTGRRRGAGWLGGIADDTERRDSSPRFRQRRFPIHSSRSAQESISS